MIVGGKEECGVEGEDDWVYRYSNDIDWEIPFTQL